MTIRVSGCPYVSSCPDESASTVLVSYDARQKATVIDCNVDIVTLGVAIGILQKEYEDCLSQMSPDVSEHIRCTIEGVIVNG